ncbi:MAG TPA: hypothetical protein VGK99_15510 [Acidobacteriota bacterium]|jgi:YVTN family beta-propeller protein
MRQRRLLFLTFLVLGVLARVGTDATAQSQLVGTVPAGSPTAVAVYEAANKIFVADQQTQSVLVIDGNTNQIIRSIPVGQGRVDNIAVNETFGKVYAAVSHDTTGPEASIWVIDAVRNEPIRQITQKITSGGALVLLDVQNDESRDKVYVLWGGGDASSGVIDVRTDQFSPITMNCCDSQSLMSFNERTGEIFFTKLSTSQLFVVNSQTLQTSILELTPTGGRAPLAISVNELENKVYVTMLFAPNQAGPGILILNRGNGNYRYVGREDLRTLAFNPLTNRLFAGVGIGIASAIVDGRNDGLTEVTLSSTGGNDGIGKIAIRRATDNAYMVAGSGNIYVLNGSTQQIERLPQSISMSSSLLSTDAAINQRTGRVYVVRSDSPRVTILQDISPTWVPALRIDTVAGSATFGLSGDDGPATAAKLNGPEGAAVDAQGNIFIADTRNHAVRKVTPAGIIITLAGNGTSGSGGDGGPASSARLSRPEGIAVDTRGNIYIADTFNSRIRKITPDGMISTFAGTGTGGFAGDGGPASSARISSPRGVAIDAAGNVFIVDSGTHRIRKVSPPGIISTVAGNGTAGFSGDGGLATSASLQSPEGIGVDTSGNLYIADGTNRVRKIDASGIITTVAGNGTQGFEGDGGPATSAALNRPRSVAVDGAGNLFITEWGNSRIRRVTPAGVISTYSGDGRTGFRGDGGPPGSAELFVPEGVAFDPIGNLYIADTGNHRIRKVSAVDMSVPVSFTDRGGVSMVSAGLLQTVSTGYARVRPNTGSTSPYGVAIFGLRQNGVLVSEAGVAATPLIQNGRIAAEIDGPVNTGLALANATSQAAAVSFFFSDQSGNFDQGTTTIPPGGQIAAFLNQPPFNGRSSVSGTFTFNSSVPIGAIALRGLANERSEFLITTLPVIDLDAAPATGVVVFPHFADGGGWKTQILLLNSSERALNGAVHFQDQSGGQATVTVNGESTSSFAYTIPPRASLKLTTSGAGITSVVGWARVVPAAGSAAPSGLAIFSFRNGGTTVIEAAVPAVPVASAFRLYAEAAGNFNQSEIGAIQTGIAIVNTAASTASVTVELTRLDGSSAGLIGMLSIPPNGQVAKFLNQIPGLTSFSTPFQGVVRVSGAVPLSVIGLRGRHNERSDFLITTMPTANEAAPASTSEVFFPHIADSGGYTTQFILFSGRAGQASTAMMQIFNQAGGAMNLTIR